MNDWQDRQVGCGELFSACAWLVGLGLVLASVAGLLSHPWANLGTLLFMSGCLRTLTSAIRCQSSQVRDAFQLGRDSASIRVLRD